MQNLTFVDERVKESKHDIDKLLHILAVEHEEKKLSARSRPSKKGKKGSSRSDED